MVIVVVMMAMPPTTMKTMALVPMVTGDFDYGAQKLNVVLQRAGRGRRIAPRISGDLVSWFVWCDSLGSWWLVLAASWKLRSLADVACVVQQQKVSLIRKPSRYSTGGTMHALCLDGFNGRSEHWESGTSMLP